MTEELVSRYIIDGVPQELTPARLLAAVAVSPEPELEDGTGTIIDESLDLPFESHDWQVSGIDGYSSLVESFQRQLPLTFAGTYTRQKVATALIDTIWRKGRFKLEDLAICPDWKWNHSAVGSNASFYESVREMADYCDALGVRIGKYSHERTEGATKLKIKTVLGSASCDDEWEDSDRTVKLGSAMACPSTLQPDPHSWVVWVPFDTSDFRLGGSCLAQAMNLGGGVGPQITDADYFIDCYEVVRELVEDGIIVSGVTVEDGGLLKAVKKFCGSGPGVTIDISDAMRAFEENNAVRVLFAEVPGALFQIQDTDFDYIDAEFLLQDVAYFPLGHPDTRSSAVRVKSSAKSSIQNILESLMQNAEGED